MRSGNASRPANGTASAFRWPMAKLSIISAAAFSGILSLLQLALPLYSMQLFDRVIPTGSIATLVTLSALMAAIIASITLINTCRSLILARLAFRLQASLQKRVLRLGKKTLGYDPVFLADLDQVRSFLPSHLCIATLDLPWSVAFFVAMFLLHPALGVIALISTAVIVGNGALYYFLTRDDNVTATVAAAKHSAKLANIRAGYATSLVLGSADRLINQLAILRTGHFRRVNRIAEKQAFIDSTGKGMRNLMQITVLAVATVLVLHHALGSGAIVASSLLFTRALTPIEGVSAGYGSLLAFATSWQRLHKALKVEANTQEQLSLHAIEGVLTLESVSVMLPKRPELLLSNIDLRVEPGTTLIVVGREGAGKSTLGKVMLGSVLPTRGCVRLDGFNLMDLPRHELGAHIGYLPDEIHEEICRISDFISRGEEPDTDKIVAAAKLAGAHELIQRLPGGYGTVVGDEDYVASAGETRRIALARALYGLPKLVVLDEPTVHLDDDGESIILRVVQKLKEHGSTVIVISRHPNLIHVADRLLMLDKGSIKLAVNQNDLHGFLTPRLATSRL